METKLSVRDLRISFRTINGKLQAVRDISFDLRKGETLAIVGESGSGKSVTSKAVLGISAGNAIIEGGCILYDGMDLAKISEDDFYKLRGDKLAMIFQDPLSSLNPIMRIGKQLTEAMILKGKARRRSNKKEYNLKMKLLSDALSDVTKNPAQAKRICEQFREIAKLGAKIEQTYSAAREAAEDALANAKEVQFLIENKALTEPKQLLSSIREFAPRAVNPYLVSARATELKLAASTLFTGLNQMMKKKDFFNLSVRVNTIVDIIGTALELERPDFFSIAYCEIAKKKVVLADIAELNAECAALLRSGFLDGFMGNVTEAQTRVDEKYAKLRKGVIEMLNGALAEIDTVTIEQFEPRAAELCAAVKASINPYDVVKDSAAYTFSGSLNGFVKDYYTGVHVNGKLNAKYQKQLAAYNAKAKRGKKPDYTVAAPQTIDLQLVKTNIVSLLESMRAHYIERNAAEAAENKSEKAERFIEYVKNCALGTARKVTKTAAKNKALKLMEEVGIDKPRVRYRQYPFEFSGGMRQRIVIAIALAADPDILICDEPTTALDVTIQAQILELINRLKRTRDLYIIFITHDLGVVANMADRIAVMYAGKIVEYGTSEEVFYSPAHPYTWALLSSMPDLDTHDKLEAIPGTPPNMIYPPKGDAFAERNRYAMKVDFERQPPAFRISDTHWAATWLLHPNAPKVDPPKIVMNRIANMKSQKEAAENA